MLCLRSGAGLAVLVACSLVACKSDRPAGATAAVNSNRSAAPRTVTVTATDYGFDAPAEIPAGVTTVYLVNHGKELHHAQLVRLEDGKTTQDVAAALKKSGPPPSWIKFVGGPNAVVPGKESNATALLTPGRYAYLCFVFGPDGVPHAAKGMMRQFEVTGPESEATGELPAADITIKMMDYGYHSSDSLTAGKHTILVENEGPQPHELALLRLAPGKTVEDFAIWGEGGMKGPPPAEPVGGVVLLDKGARGTFTADLVAGEYGLICFVPDAKDGKPHLAHGMMRTIKVG
jgi:plastocyanin